MKRKNLLVTKLLIGCALSAVLTTASFADPCTDAQSAVANCNQALAGLNTASQQESQRLDQIHQRQHELREIREERLPRCEQQRQSIPQQLSAAQAENAQLQAQLQQARAENQQANDEYNRKVKWQCATKDLYSAAVGYGEGSTRQEAVQKAINSSGFANFGSRAGHYDFCFEVPR